MFLNQQNRNYLLATLITIISFSCKFSNEKNRIIEVDSKLSLEQIVRQKKAFIIKIDSLFNMHDKRFLKVYVKVLNPKRYLFINDLKKIPKIIWQLIICIITIAENLFFLKRYRIVNPVIFQTFIHIISMKMEKQALLKLHLLFLVAIVSLKNLRLQKKQ